MTSYKMIIFGIICLTLASMSLYAYFIPNSYSFDGNIPKNAIEWSVILFNLQQNDTISYHFTKTTDSPWEYQAKLYSNFANFTVPSSKIPNIQYVIPDNGNYTLRFFIHYPANGTVHYWIDIVSHKPQGIDHIVFFSVLSGFGVTSIVLSNRKKEKKV